MSSRTSTDPGNAPAFGADGMIVSRSVWGERYELAAALYESLPFSPELLEALAEGLREWASLLPQTEQTASGRHKPVNSWGLGAEFHKLREVEIQLDLDGDQRNGDRLGELARALKATAKKLDACYPLETHEEAAAMRRIVRAARIQAGVLRNFLKKIKRRLFTPRVGSAGDAERSHSPPQRPTHQPAKITAAARKRASRAAAIEALEKELTEHIRAAADHLRTRRDMGAGPAMLPRPTQTELARRIGAPGYTVSRCLRDPTAHKLQLLWRTADDPDAILRYVRKR